MSRPWVASRRILVLIRKDPCTDYWHPEESRNACWVVDRVSDVWSDVGSGEFRGFLLGPYAQRFLLGPMLDLYMSWACWQRSDAPIRWDMCRNLNEGQIRPLQMSSEEGSRLIPFSGMTFHPVVGVSSYTLWRMAREHLRESSWDVELTVIETTWQCRSPTLRRDPSPSNQSIFLYSERVRVRTRNRQLPKWPDSYRSLPLGWFILMSLQRLLIVKTRIRCKL